MLKYRLVFGTIMAVVFAGLLVLDGWMDGSLSPQMPNAPIQATIVCVLIGLLAIPAQLEMAQLARSTGARVFLPTALPASVLMATGWYWRQFSENPAAFHLYYLLAVGAALVLGTFLYQAWRFGTEGTVRNISATLFSVLYLGFLSSFVLGVRVDFGLWALFLIIFAVKSSDIGAYTAGKLFGKHKFSPRISPGKTWEGLAGAMLLAAVVSVLLSAIFRIMDWRLGVLFGALFAFLGQLGDLAESMIKRDAGQKDSASRVPGFGGVLDVIDSPLATAPLAYLFLWLAAR